MSDEHEQSEKNSSAGAWSVGIVAALLFYFLSIGPCALLRQNGVISDGGPVDSSLNVFYKPLIFLVDRNDHLGKLFEAYFKLLGIKGERS